MEDFATLVNILQHYIPSAQVTDDTDTIYVTIP